MSTHRYSKYIPIIFLIGDLFTLNIGVFLSYNIITKNNIITKEYQLFFLFINLLYIVIFFFSKLYTITRESNLADHFNKLFTGLLINIFIVFTFWFLLQPVEYSRKFLLLAYLFFAILLLVWRASWHYFIRYYRKKGYNIRRVIVIGSDSITEKIKNYFYLSPELGYQYVGSFDIENDNLDSQEKLLKYIQEKEVDIIFCYLPSLSHKKIDELIDFSESNLLKINLISHFSELVNYKLAIKQLGDFPIIEVNSIPLDLRVNRNIKRCFDILFSMMVIITILSWLVPLLTVLIKIESKGPVFFKQLRHGRKNKFFFIYKFRTMYLHKDSKVKQAVKYDNRVTRIGNILRKTSIDELPQFINVLKGEMSVVGPRPHAVQHNDQYQPQIKHFWKRHEVKPGITGLAQAKGFRGEIPNIDLMINRVRLDHFYVKHWSLWLDTKIVLLTIYSVLMGDHKNAY